MLGKKLMQQLRKFLGNKTNEDIPMSDLQYCVYMCFNTQLPGQIDNVFGVTLPFKEMYSTLLFIL